MNRSFDRAAATASKAGPRRLVHSALALGALLGAAPLTVAHATEPEQAFKNACGPCHSSNRVHRIGPSLVGVAGRVSGSAPAFEYSSAMKKAAVTWDRPTLDRFLLDPKAVVAGTRMSYPGLKDPALREAIVGFVIELGAR